jgi:hypothetical protein
MYIYVFQIVYSPSYFLTKILCATSCTHLICLDLIALIVLWSTSYEAHYAVFSSLCFSLGPGVFLITLFSNTFTS